MIRHRKSLFVVVGVATLVASALGTANTAAAHWHQSDVGAGVAAGAATGLSFGAIAGVVAANTSSAAQFDDAGSGSCYLQRQRVWDGYGWQIQRVQVCD